MSDIRIPYWQSIGRGLQVLEIREYWELPLFCPMVIDLPYLVNYF